MPTYVRPLIDAPVIRDATGEVIDYGNRWGDVGPPEDTYSVDSHPERFAPLHTVADALIAHLVETFDVDVVDGTETADDLEHAREDVVRSVRVTPRDERCAALTFVLSDYPGVDVHAGLLHDFPYPICGCDACDYTWDSQAEDLEQLVLAVTAGGYRESVARGRRPDIRYSVTHAEGSSSGALHMHDVPRARLRAARERLSNLPDGGWAAWPLRP